MINAELNCLEVLLDESIPNAEMCLHFKTIQKHTGYDRRKVRVNVRRLARKGFAEYAKGLCTEEGDFAGAGYCITEAGREEAVRLLQGRTGTCVSREVDMDSGR